MIGEALLAHLSSVGTLGREDSEAVRRITGEVRTIRRYKDILSPGEVPRSLVIVLKGLLARHKISGTGIRQIHAFCMPTDAPTLEALHLDYVDDSLGALVSSTVGFVPYERLLRVKEERPRVAALMERAGVLQGSVCRQWLMRNCTLPAHASMANLFCEIYARADAAGLVDDGSCELPVTQQNLGEALGLTAVHVNRTLQRLRQSGLVQLKLGRLIIDDFDKLAKLAHFDADYLHLTRGGGSLRRGRTMQAIRQRAPISFDEAQVVGLL